jgi:glycosyltransferase involved in cell wall biosynthesis
MRLSICVCTYNRAHILPYCLESLKKLEVPAGCETEILVIDNNSHDDTKDVVDRAAQQSPIPVLYHQESQQGISSARNRALKEARGDYMGFLDDECVVPSNWLEVVVADIHEFGPPIIGGPYVGALLPGGAPKWFKPEYGNAYFLVFDFKRGYQKNFRASGGNMFLHRRVCESVQFNPELGMKGNEMKLGEEVLLQNQFLNDNPGTMVFYEPSIEVAHFIVPEKMSLTYRARREMEAAASNYQIGAAALAVEIGRALTFLCQSPFRMLLRSRRVYPYWQNYAYERIIPQVMPVLGAAVEKVRGRYR